MMNPTVATIARLAPLLALFSCAPPKAIVVAEPLPTAPETQIAAAPEVSEPEPTIPALPNDGIRLPDMMTMPGDDEFRTNQPGQSTPGSGSGAVIARPPTEPPPRPKSE